MRVAEGALYGAVAGASEGALMKTRMQLGVGSVMVAGMLAGAGCGPLPVNDPASGSPAGSVPISTTVPAVLSGDITYLVSDPNVSAALVVAGGTLYFVDRGSSISDSVQRLDLASTTVATLFTASPDPSAAIEDLDVDASNVYVTQVTVNGGLYTSRVTSVPRTGGPATELATADVPLFDVSVAAGSVYYLGLDRMWGVPAAGGPVTTIAGAGLTLSAAWEVTSIGTAGGAFYWAEVNTQTNKLSNARIRTVDASGGTPRDVATFEETDAPTIAANASSLFWVTSPASQDYVVQAPVGGGQPSVVTAASGKVVGLAADDTYVFVLTADPGGSTQTLTEYALDGSTVSELVTGIQPPYQGSASHALALDATNVYFAMSGAVVSVPK